MKKTTMIALAACAAALAGGCRWLGCPDKTVAVDGYFARVSEAGATLGIGKVTTVPRDAAYVHAEYVEDTAFFAPTTKTRSWAFTCTGGTNWVPPEAWTAIEGLKKYRLAREEEEVAGEKGDGGEGSGGGGDGGMDAAARDGGDGGMDAAARGAGE